MRCFQIGTPTLQSLVPLFLLISLLSIDKQRVGGLFYYLWHLIVIVMMGHHFWSLSSCWFSYLLLKCNDGVLHLKLLQLFSTLLYLKKWYILKFWFKTNWEYMHYFILNTSSELTVFFVFYFANFGSPLYCFVLFEFRSAQQSFVDSF